MSFDNKPLLTVDELASHVALLCGNVATTDGMLLGAVGHVLVSHADRLKMRFSMTLPLPAYGCELNVEQFAIDDVQNVEETCGDGCWRNVAWFWEKNHIILTQSTRYERAIRIEYYAHPPRMTPAANYGTLSLAYDAGMGAAALPIVSALPSMSIPTSGYVRISNAANALWLEYRSITVTSATVVSLLFPAPPPWNNDAAVYPIGSTLEWGITFSSSLKMDATAAQAAGYYWAARTGNCNSEEDRSFATQMMNFWMGEAEKKWKHTPSSRKARIIRKDMLESLIVTGVER